MSRASILENARREVSCSAAASGSGRARSVLGYSVTCKRAAWQLAARDGFANATADERQPATEPASDLLEAAAAAPAIEHVSN
jgi:hypothetical protein